MSLVGPDLLEFVRSCTSWCFEEAEKLMHRLNAARDNKKVVIFETGYGPSGLPHIGTFGEVARTLMVAHCYDLINKTNSRSKLICFSDDMDGFRKVPGNVPCQEEMAAYLGQPLSVVPDPFALKELLQSTRDEAKIKREIKKLPSFAASNNARLRAFLDYFGFKYEFASATEHYKSGKFDSTLQKMMQNYDQIMQIMLPSLRAERQASYSIFLPISQVTGQVLQVPILSRNEAKGTIIYKEPTTGKEVEQSIFGGSVKCQWKADWALRWVALGVDYEMAGKDLIDSVALSSKISKKLGRLPPAGFNYELFLDENGQKISKSKGNGLTIEQWLKYAPNGSLRLYMYQKPKSAKRLSFDIIPKVVDEYYKYLKSYRQSFVDLSRVDLDKYVNNPLYFAYSGDDIDEDVPPLSYALLLNLVNATGKNASEELLWNYLVRLYGAEVRNNRTVTKLIKYAINYYKDYVASTISLATATPFEAEVLHKLYDLISSMQQSNTIQGDEIQNNLLNLARQYEAYQDPSKKNSAGQIAVNGAFFQMLYKTLLGQASGPRLGSFIELYGLQESKQLVGQAIWRSAIARIEAAKLWAKQEPEYKQLLAQAEAVQHAPATQADLELGVISPALLELEQLAVQMEALQQ